VKRALFVAWLSGIGLVGMCPVAVSAQTPDRPGGAETRPVKPRTALEMGRNAFYKGDFELADAYLRQAQEVRAQLAPTEQSELDMLVKRNSESLKGRLAALDLIKKASDAIEAGRTKEAESLLRSLQANKFLNANDRQVVATMSEQLRKGGNPARSPGNRQTPQDPDSLLVEARKAFERKDYDQAEMLANAARQNGFSTIWPWSDTPEKVLKDVAAARGKMNTSSMTTSPAAQTGDARKVVAREKLKQAHQSVRAGDTVTAARLVKEVEEMKVSFAFYEDLTPEKLRNEISKVEAKNVQQATHTPNQPAPNHTPAPANADARQLVREAKKALEMGDLDRAEQLARQARLQQTNWGLFEDTADSVLSEVAKAREQVNSKRASELLAQARRLFEQGQFDEAEKLTYQAEALRRNYPMWYRGERPDRLRAEINAKRRTATKPQLPPLLDPAAPQRPTTAAAPKPPATMTEVAQADPRVVQANAMLMQARVHLNRGEYKAAVDLAQQVKAMNVTLTATSDSPDAIIKAVQVAMGYSQQQENPAAAEVTRRQALQLVAEARLRMREENIVAAQELVAKARALGAFYQPKDDTPDWVMSELQAKAAAQVKTYADAARTLVERGEMKKAEAYLAYVQKVGNAFSIDTRAVVAELQPKLAGNVVVQAPPMAPTPPTPPTAGVMAPPSAPVAANAPAPTMPEAPAAPPSAPTVAQAALPMPEVPTPPVAPPAPPTVAQTPPVAAPSQGQQMLAEARTALQQGNTLQARKLAEAVFTGNPDLKGEANVLLTQIDQAEEKVAIERARMTFEQFVRACHRKEYEVAKSYAQSLDVSKLDVASRQQFQELMMSNELRPQVTQAEAPAAQTNMVAQAQAQQPAGAGAQPPTGDGMAEFRARQEVEFQRLRELKRQSELKANQLAQKGDLEGAMAELKAVLAEVQKASLDPELSAKLERQLNERLSRFKTMAEQVAFAKMQERQLKEVSEKKSRLVLARQHQQEQVAALMKEYANLMKENKFTEAEHIAMKARELDPDNVQADAAVFRARMMRNVTDDNRIRENQVRGTTTALQDIQAAATPKSNDANPLTFDKKILERANIRKDKKQPGPMPVQPPSPRDTDTMAKLDTVISVDFKNKPMREILDELRAMTGVNIVPQDQFLREENISLDYPVDHLALQQVSLKTVLNLLLSKARLTYVIQDGVVLVTTPAAKRQDVVTRIYPIRDLIHPRDDMSLSAGQPRPTWQLAADGPTQLTWTKHHLDGSMMDGQGASVGSTAPTDGRRVGQTMHQQLRDLIVQTIQPSTWDQQGGSGKIEYYPVAGSLVVTQTGDIQEQIEALLGRLRELQELQVTVEVRIIQLTDDFFERVGIDFDMQIKTASTKFNNQVATQNFAPPGQINTPGNVNTIVGLQPVPTNPNNYAFTSTLMVPVSNSSFQAAAPVNFPLYQGAPLSNGGLDLGLAFLSSIQVFLFMEAVQGDVRSNQLQAPKLTMFNGQLATLNANVTDLFVTSVQAQRDFFTGAIVFIPITTPITTGLSVSIQAAITADRKYVLLSLAPTITQLANRDRQFTPIPGLTLQQPSIENFTVSTSVMVPDGGTILLGGIKRMREARREFGPPVLSKIPYINRLFRNNSYARESSSVLLMVTPRIIIPEEEEERLNQTFAF
jgi:hypothetical protein